MAFNPKDYPANWRDLVSQRRAIGGNCCEWCGVPNLVWYRRIRADQWREVEVLGKMVTKPYHDFEVWGSPFKPDAATRKELRLKRVVLTTSHLDRSLDNNDIENLRSLCQRCHLNHDRHAQHLPNRKYGRKHARDHQTKLELQ